MERRKYNIIQKVLFSMVIPVLFIVLLWAGDPDSLAQLMEEVF